MKRFLSKAAAYLLAFAVILGTGNLLSCLVEASESTAVNVYDATTFGEMLRTKNVDIVLWQDISYDGTDKVLCSSVDLNGYNLTCSKTLKLGGKMVTLNLLDSQYSSKSSNTATFSEGINIGDGTLKIESGVISVLRETAKKDNHGIYGTGNVEFIGGSTTVKGGSSPSRGAGTIINSNDGADCGDSDKSGNGIQVKNVTVHGGKVSVSGGIGGVGGKGGDGRDGRNGVSGGKGGNGGNGGNGGSGIQATNVFLYGGRLFIAGGDGGNGGDGGDGGDGGSGIQAARVIVCGGYVRADGGNYGKYGNYGNYGIHGRGSGLSGGRGKSGSNGFCGGAGIHANLEVEAGTVVSVGGKWSAGIGGTGNGYGIEGTDVTISGGNVTVTAGEKSFGIGGGFDGTKTGIAGKLTVTGGTLILSSSGRGTNAVVPSFRNCAVLGAGANQYEGLYNADGKFTVTVQNIDIQPTAFVGLDPVTVTAAVQISRSTNITTPKLKGYISFKLDGTEFATASVTDAVSAGGMIAAAASTAWTAAEGTHNLSAEYVAGDNNDMYASGGIYEESTDIPVHTHNWNSEYTIDLKPTCTAPGSKSIHCSICDVQKDFVTIDATGHNYVDHQCQNCKEFSPLIVFKDYDGTVLSSKYYHLGDSVTEPEVPFREADNVNKYTFIGWDKEVVACEGDAVYTAVYDATPIEYTVIFKNYDGSELLRNTYHYGDAVVIPSDILQKPADLQHEYIFAGWDSVVGMCDGNKVYTAVFTSKLIEYAVTFKNYDGSIISTNTYHYGDTVQIPNEPSQPSDSTYTYAFEGWDKKVTAVTGNAVYTAIYKATHIDYMVTFKDWNGTVLSAKTYHHGDKVTAPDNPTRAADIKFTYTFSGWDSEVVACDGNTTYTATYKANHIDYTVTFKDWNATVLSTKTYHYGDKVTVPYDPTRAADKTYTYTFAGWDKNVVVVTGNAVYTATYTRKHIDYTVIFKDWDGTELSRNTYHYGDKVTVPKTPVRAADCPYTYTFVGWDSEVIACNGNATYTATYDANYLGFLISGTVTGLGTTDGEITIRLLQNGVEVVSVISEDGTYSLLAPEPGDYVLSVSKPDCVTKKYEITVERENISLDLVSCLIGDLNRDGKITAADALMTLQIAVGKLQPDEEQAKAADVDGESGVTVRDALLILQYAVGKIERFPTK